MFTDTFLPPWSYPLQSPLSRVVVIPDSEYQAYQRNRAEQEILVLENKKNRYVAAIAEIEAEIKNIKETHGLLPETSPTNEIKELLE